MSNDDTMNRVLLTSEPYRGNRWYTEALSLPPARFEGRVVPVVIGVDFGAGSYAPHQPVGTATLAVQDGILMGTLNFEDPAALALFQLDLVELAASYSVGVWEVGPDEVWIARDISIREVSLIAKPAGPTELRQ